MTIADIGAVLFVGLIGWAFWHYSRKARLSNLPPVDREQQSNS